MESFTKRCFRGRQLILLLFLVLSFCLPVKGVVSQMPSHACVGEDITVDCDLSVPDPNNNNFRTNFIEFIVGSSDVPISDDVVNAGSSVHGGVNLTRLTAFANNSFSGDKTIRGNITLSSYTASDADIRLGCSAVYFLSGNTGATSVARETPLLTPAAPHSAPSLQSSVSNFNTATCSADISLSWNTPPSNRTVDRYFLYLDGSSLATANSSSYIHSTILNINTDYQYSVTAMSCAGNSTNGSVIVNSIASYSLMSSSQSTCLDYNMISRRLTFNLGLEVPTQPSGVSGLDITYSLQLLYSHSRQGVTYTYTDSTSFTLPSSQLSYNTVLTAHNFPQLDGVVTNITANLTIVQQCEQSFNGTAMECSSLFSSKTRTNPSVLAPILGSIFGVLVVCIIVIIIICCVIFYVSYKKKKTES